MAGMILLQRTDVGVRPTPDIWSALEYACHVRDVFKLYDLRLHLMLDRDAPKFANWNQDVTAVEQRYGAQDAACSRHRTGECGRAAGRLIPRCQSRSVAAHR